MRDATLLATRYAGRPLLLTPDAARELAARVRTVDSRAFAKPGRLSALLRKVGLAGSASRDVLAMDDDDVAPEVPMEQRLAYAPRWLGDPDDTGFCWSLKDGVALMCADTPLVERGDAFCGMVWHGYDTLLLGMREAMADERVHGLFLRLDSPGGVVAGGISALAAFMREARETAGGKPIWVYADMACSAAYWIAAQGDRILAPSVGYVGSIGAVIVHENWAGALAEEGIEITSIEFPDGGEKTDGAWWKALSDSAKAAWKADVAQCGRLFLADVVAGRPSFTAEALIATRAGVFMAEHDEADRSGLALGFVDAIATEEDAFAQLVAHINSDLTNPAPAPGQTQVEPPQGSGSASATQENSMRGLTAAEKARKTRLEADLAKLNAKAETETGAEGAGDETGDDEDDADDQGDDKKDKKAPEVDDDKGDQSDAEAISASADAKSHPHLALAAIQSGQTLKQFKATVGAQASAPRTSKLDAALANARRLGADGGSGGTGNVFADAMSARAEANRKAQTDRKAG